LKDGLQGISFDRWLMRIKDLLQIIITICGIAYGFYKYVKTVEQKDSMISQQQLEISNLRTQLDKQ
jgi:hypothetical protein